MSYRDTRKAREERSNEVAPATADSVLARVEARIAWLNRELQNVPSWQQELAMLQRMRDSAKPPEVKKSAREILDFPSEISALPELGWDGAEHEGNQG